MNINVKILSAFDALDKKIKTLADRFDTLSKQAGPKGDKGERGEQGKAGRDGRNGQDGKDGSNGKDGRDGKDGIDGENGVGIADAVIDIDNHLVLTLTDGNEIDAGSLALDAVDIGNTYVSNAIKQELVRYTNISTTPYYISKADLIVGHNVFGVNAGADATVYLPSEVEPTKLIVINNESSTFTLTIDTYVEP